MFASPSRRVRAVAALAAITFVSACQDAIAPVRHTIESVAAKLSNLVTCDVTWSQPVTGEWSNAARWSTGAVPTATQNVCITLEGDYSVHVRNLHVAKSVTVSAPGNETKPKLFIEGFNLAAGFGSSTGRLTVSEGIDNYGYIHMSAVGPFPGFTQLIVNGGVLHNHDIAEFRTIVGSGGGQRLVQAHVVNEGTMVLEQPAAGFLSITNNAYFRIGDGLFLQPGAITFTQNDGTFSIGAGATYSQSGGSFVWNGGTFEGVPIIMGALTINTEEAGTLAVRSQSTLNGNVAADQVIEVQGWQLAAGWNETPASLKWESGLVNKGIIRLTSTGGPMNGSANLNAAAGLTVVNEGRIEVLVGLGNVRSITANIDNRPSGVVDVQQNMSYAPPLNSVTTNSGLWKIAAGKRFFVQQHQITFRQNGGTLDVTDATYDHLGTATFEMNGGTIIGEPMVQGILRIGAGSTATGRVFTLGQTQLIGDVMPGQTVTMGVGPNTNATLSAPASFTNRGTIILTSYGTNTGWAALVVPSTATITNAAEGRIETIAGTGFTDRHINGNVVNNGTLHIATRTFMTGPVIRTSGPITGGGELRNWGGTMFASGAVQANLMNTGAFHVGQATGAAGKLDITGWFHMNGGSLTVDIGGSVPGTDFDKITASNWAQSSGALNVGTTIGGCAGGGSSYEIIKAGSHAGDYSPKNGLNLGGGRTVTTVSSGTNYVLNVSGPVCIPPDVTPPVIVPTVTGTLGLNSWYTSDVGVTWSVTDLESAITSSTGCTSNSVTTDNAGTTFTCSATSAGGTATQSVTIKRDATAPTVTASRAPAANINGWNNTDVTASWSASDGMSGLAGSGAATELFTVEGLNQGASRTFSDNAGNSTTASVAGISIDKAAPVVTVTRSPIAGPDGWNETDVTVTYSATDALSGLAGAALFEQVFTLGENQSGSRTFTDLAGNSATGTISGINIRTPPPPPPPPPAPGSIGSATPSAIWPANNKMTSVVVTMCSGVASYTLRSVTNNETGESDVEGWAIGTADLSGFVRAARNGSGNGRTYTLIYDTIGTNGSASSCTVTVTVAHDQGKKK
jgi:hypothetical protein